MKHLIKEIARGAKGARDLNADDAEALMRALLEGRLSDLELGAICIALRIKGEGLEELLGFESAMENILPKVRTTRPTLVLPSYNGARKSALLTPLVAHLMAKRGVPTLIHGHHEEDHRVSSASVFAALEWPIANNPRDIETALESEGYVYASLTMLSPKLTALLDIRKTLGLRNFGHVLTKLMNVIEGESLRVVNYTHPEYPEKLGQFFQSRGHAALLMRGHEGEPTCSLTRIPERTLCHGLNTPLHFPEQQYEPLTNAPLSSDSVAFTEAVVSGRAAVPKIIDDFCDMLAGEIRRLSA